MNQSLSQLISQSTSQSIIQAINLPSKQSIAQSIDGLILIEPVQTIRVAESANRRFFIWKGPMLGDRGLCGVWNSHCCLHHARRVESVIIPGTC